MVSSLDAGLIQSIQEIGQNHAVEKIVLFGSRAKGDYKSVSDIDLAIFLSPESNCQGYLASELVDLDTLLKIAILFINEHIDPKLLENIKREGISLYERAEH